MKLPKELKLIVPALALLVAVNVFLKRDTPARQRPGDAAKYTSYSAEAEGTKALYLLLEKLGYKSRRLRIPNFSGRETEGLAIILGPDRPPIEKADAEPLLEWLRHGNTLLFAPNKHDDQLAQALGIELHGGQTPEISVAPSASTVLSAGIQSLAIPSGDRLLARRNDAVQHFGDSAGGVVFSLQEGAGTAIVLSDPYLMTNAGLQEDGSLDLLVNILYSHAADRGTVYFDEYHHGFARRPTVLHLLKGTRLGWALLQVAAAVVLLMYSRGRRFGQPRPVPTEGHRSSVEYVTSLAGIYRTVQALDLALLNIHRRLLRSTRNTQHDGNISDLMAECRRGIEEGKIGEKDLIDLSRRIELARRPRKGG